MIVDPSSFGAPRSTYRVVTSLTAANVPVYMVRRGEEIGRALSHPIGLSDAAPPTVRPAPEPPPARAPREEVRGGMPVQQPAAP